MDLNGQGNRRLSSLISRFQKNALQQEGTNIKQKPEARIEPRHRNATTKSHDDQLNTSADPLKCLSSSKAWLIPANQSSHWPESSKVDTENNLVHDWAATETSPALDVKAECTEETSPASGLTTIVSKETGPASEVKAIVAEKTSPASEAKTMVSKETGPASDAETEATVETSPASEFKTACTEETKSASEIKTLVSTETSSASDAETTCTKDTSPAASEVQTTIRSVSSEDERYKEADAENSRNQPEAGTSDVAENGSDTESEGEEEAASKEDSEDDNVHLDDGSSVDYYDIADFDVDEFGDDSSDEDLPTLQEIYQRCQTIRKRRFYEDLYTVWQKNIQREEKADAIRILTGCGFDKSDPDDMADGLDTALSLVPERFWCHSSNAKEISIEDLKTIVEEKKDAEERAQYREFCKVADGGGAQPGQSRQRRAAITTGGGQSSTILHNYLKMNLLKSHVPMYYFPSYLLRFQYATKRDLEAEDKDKESD